MTGTAYREAPEVAVIPAAGRGVRMRPATRALPKAFLPVVDRPAVQYAVEEAARAGAVEVYIVVDPEVATLADKHFGVDQGLPGLDGIQVSPIIQREARGLGDAVLVAEQAVGGRAFTCLLADNLLPPGTEVLTTMARAAAGGSVLCLQRVEPERLQHLGVVIAGEQRDADIVEVLGAVEKPRPLDSPSRLAIMGRYLFQPDVFDALRDLPPGYGGEIQLTDAIHRLGAAGACRGYISDIELLDVGTPLGFLTASTVIGLAHAQYGEPYLEFLRSMRAHEATEGSG